MPTLSERLRQAAQYVWQGELYDLLIEAAGALEGEEPVAWRYQDARGHFRYRGYVPGFDKEYAMLKPVPLYAAKQLPASEEMSPEFTDTARAALLWVLYHHQGGSSKVGQPIRFALGMGAHEHLNDHQLREAKRWGEIEEKFAATQPQERKPLTEGEIMKCIAAAGCYGTVKMSFESGPYSIDRPSINADRFARAIEAAHGIKD